MSAAQSSLPVHDAPTFPVDFHPDRTHLLSAFVMTCILLLVIGVRPEETAGLGFDSRWLLLLLVGPALFVYWVLRARTRVTATGITTRPAFAAGHTASWEQIEGIQFRKSKALLQVSDQEPFPLPGVTFNSLTKLAAASNGRIPDVINEGYAAATNKVVIMRKDGRQIIVSREEYEARQQAAQHSAQQ
ncbi:PH domain-containing protein [Corynebacterium choanae]|uniref:Low molecular weight protein antigen 6 n=1 Tax=Corynebacterium choanae TaxID=1862358 RepID=A0A3G6J615_9CORY|nr:PH domain-containing protein [Corynebacterium choanae]AZA13379.1 Low molecular weight protein antigen 6 [Corynebacterium choanae]